MANFAVKIGSKANYLALGTYDAGTLYFCQDTREVFRGDVLYTEPVRFVAELPASPAQGVLYINTTTEEGSVYTGSEWKTVTKKFVTIVDENSTDTEVATAKAVYTAVNGVATDVATLKGDENTEGSVAKALKDAKAYADGKDASIEAAQSAADAAQGAADAAQGDVDALEELVGTLPEGATATTVVGYAKEVADAAKAYFDENAYDDTELRTLANNNKSAIDVLNGTGDGSVSKQVADAVAQIVNEAPEAYDTLKEISDWITSHSGSAAEMNSAIQTNAQDIEALEKLVGTLPEGAASETVVAYISEVVNAAIAGADLSKYALASDLTAAVGRITAVEGAVQTAQSTADGAQTAAEQAQGEVDALEEYVGTFTPQDETVTTVVKYVDASVKGASDKADAAQAAAEAAQGTADSALSAAGTAQGEVDALETLVGALPEGTTATTVVGYVDEKVEAAALQWIEF